MRAAVFHGNRDIRVEEVHDPTPGEGELLLNVVAAGICGTDAAEWAVGPNMFPIHERHPETGHVGPMIPGHEIAGTVAQVGAGVKGFREGDLVVTGAGISCGACRSCRKGRTNLCDRYATVGLQRNGGLAQFCAVPASTCVVAPPGLTGDAAALGQPMAIAVHSMRRGAPEPGETCLVIGVGGIGVFLVYALAQTAIEVIAVDLDESRLATAATLGARYTVRPNGSTAGELGHLATAPGVVYEVTGTSAGIAAAIDVVEKGGRVVAVGLQDEPREIDLRAVTLRELSLIGTNAHVCGNDLPEALRMLAARQQPWADVAPVALPLDLLVSKGIEPLAEGRSERIKTLFDPWAQERRATEMRVHGATGTAVGTEVSGA